ncbi:MAG: ribonuclease III [Bacteroidetes bacterium]|nr:ribonuclease III [Bacteroidota bacterium]
MLQSFLKNWKNKYKRSKASLSSSQSTLLRKILGFKPGDIALYELAFKHKSISKEALQNNERLEFLGDAILNSIVSEYLFNKYPEADEGFLSELRAKVVNRAQLNELGLKIGCADLIELDKAMMNQELTATSILGNALEALIGAIYLDQGYKSTETFIVDLVTKNLDLDKLVTTEFNFKSRLLEWAQKERIKIAFDLVREDESGDKKVFEVEVIADGKVLGSGKDTNKKQAEQKAAKIAYRKIFTH